VKCVAYFSMEYGLSESLPLYAGGLGILAGDLLKAASDLGVPVVGVGLLYQQGYFRQMLDANGKQQESYPYNEPNSLPIQPARGPDGTWLEVPLRLPGRMLLVRIWQAMVGRVPLILLDSNHPLNSPADRGVTAKLYGDGKETRFLQELVLGIGGWRALEALKLPVEVCHLNEGHAAFVVLERARSYMQQSGLSFREALWATRAGNVFTTHTPVAVAFDTFPADIVRQYFPFYRDFLHELGISEQELLALGRQHAADSKEPVNMAYIALHGSATVSAVSRLHGAVSRKIFQPLFPDWPEEEVPIVHVTNGVHVPSWDSAWADELWTQACGKGRWLGSIEDLVAAIEALDDTALWNFRSGQLQDLVVCARKRLVAQFGQRGADPDTIARAHHILDPNILTIGFARRFTEYKRPNLLLHDPARLARLLNHRDRPVQVIVAGKAHPADQPGKKMIEAWAEFVCQPAVRHRAVFLEDYDMALAQVMIQGMDVWINTPRRPWEASGTSGMKVLVNGGLNLSMLDGWWAEAYAPQLGWCIGDGREHEESEWPQWDARDAEQLYAVLENEVAPEFYNRDAQGIPRRWVARMRASMARLAPQFSGNRMMKEYVQNVYLPAARAYRRRVESGSKLPSHLDSWYTKLNASWHQIRIEKAAVAADGDRRSVTIPVYLGEISADCVQVQLYAQSRESDGTPEKIAMQRCAAIPGAANGYWFEATVPGSRPIENYTARVVPYHPEASIPIEAAFIHWQK
jgi:glycogen phosphorylase